MNGIVACSTDVVWWSPCGPWSLVPTRRSIPLLKQENKKDDYANSHSAMIFARPSSSRTIHPSPLLAIQQNSRLPAPSIGGPPATASPPGPGGSNRLSRFRPPSPPMGSVSLKWAPEDPATRVHPRGTGSRAGYKSPAPGAPPRSHPRAAQPPPSSSSPSLSRCSSRSVPGEQ